ncbi:hypothetical protein ACV22V_31350 [Burkholderia sp. AW33-5]
MKFPIKSLLLAAIFGTATMANATGIPGPDIGVSDVYLKQAQAMADQVNGLTRGLTIAQTLTLPANLGALPSTYADSGKAAPAPSVDTNQQILATLIRVEQTLQQLLELERAKATGLFPANGKATR